jgi:pimeloyl-ACP methyl ester carboxylesterase
MKILKKVFYAILILVGVLVLVYAFGPKPEKPNLMARIFKMESNLKNLETQVAENERNTQGLRPDNEARIVWADTTKKEKTPFSVVYLPGFSASQFEGEPMHRDFAKRYGCNLFLARLQGHGIESKDNLIDFTAESYFESAEKAIAIGKELGEKVIIISSSTGGTLSLLAASQDPDIHALIMYSPNIAIADKAAKLLNKPWGLKIAKMVHNNSDYHEFDPKDVDIFTKKYWTWRYRIEALVQLENLLDYGMNDETFAKVKCPVFSGYYYEDEKNQDPVVSVAAIQDMMKKLGTPIAQRYEKAFPKAKAHVIACKLRSKQFEDIQAETFKFAEEILHMTAK